MNPSCGCDICPCCREATSVTAFALHEHNLCEHEAAALRGFLAHPARLKVTPKPVPLATPEQVRPWLRRGTTCRP